MIPPSKSSEGVSKITWAGIAIHFQDRVIVGKVDRGGNLLRRLGRTVLLLFGRGCRLKIDEPELAQRLDCRLQALLDVDELDADLVTPKTLATNPHHLAGNRQSMRS